MNNEKKAPVLTLEMLSPYLPHGVEVKTEDGIFKVVGWVDDIGICLDTIFYGSNAIPEYKLILRPLSDLTKEIDHNGGSFVPMVRICEFLKIKFKHFQLLDKSVDLVLNDKKSMQVRLWFSNFQGIFFNCSDMGVLRYRDHYGAIQKLFEWHFDIFGLIEKGLAIDINSIEGKETIGNG